MRDEAASVQPKDDPEMRAHRLCIDLDHSDGGYGGGSHQGLLVLNVSRDVRLSDQLSFFLQKNLPSKTRFDIVEILVSAVYNSRRYASSKYSPVYYITILTYNFPISGRMSFLNLYSELSHRLLQVQSSAPEAEGTGSPARALML